LILPLIAVVDALQPALASHAFAPASQAPITITPDNVELDGAGMVHRSVLPSTLEREAL
jgi:hypothetical protein